MNKLIIKDINKEISDALIWEMAFLGCVPAFYEYALRAKTKTSPRSKLKKLYLTLKSSGAEFPEFAVIETMPKIKLLKLAKELTLITPKLYKAPVRSLVSPLNSEKNNILLLQERLGFKIEHLVDDLNKKKFRFTDNDKKLSNRDFYEIKASLLFLNWFLIKPTYIRPNVNNITYTFSAANIKQFDLLKRSTFFESLGALRKLKSHEISYVNNQLQKNDTSRRYLRLNSNKLNTYLKNTSEGKVNNISRLYSAIYKMDLINKDILDRLPIFILLNKRNFEVYPQVLKLYKLGYRRMLHLRFLKTDCLDLMYDEKLRSLISRLISH